MITVVSCTGYLYQLNIVYLSDSDDHFCKLSGFPTLITDIDVSIRLSGFKVTRAIGCSNAVGRLFLPVHQGYL